MKFLFIVPRFAIKGKYYSFPHGIAYVYANMKKHGFDVACLNLCHTDDTVKFQITRAIAVYTPDVILTGGMSAHWALIEEVLNVVKSVNSNIKTIVGGAIITSDPELALGNLQIDYGVIGEGEEICVELCRALEHNQNAVNVKGICFKNNGFIFITENRGMIKNLDVLPFPAYKDFGFDEWIYIKQIEKGGLTGLLFDNDPIVAEISTSRSCPFRCTFCYHPLGNMYRQRSLDNIFEEIEYLYKTYGVNLLNILDEMFINDADRLREFVSRMNKYPIYWNAQMRADVVNDDILTILKGSKCIIMGIGVESLNDAVLKSMKKGITKADIEKAYSLCTKHGIRTGSNIILGDPTETEDTIKESLDWFKSHPEHDLNIRYLLAIPNSEIWKHALKHGIITDKLDHIKKGFPVVNLTTILDEKFNNIHNKVLRDEFNFKFYSRGKVINSTKHNNKYEISVICPICKQISTYKHDRWTHAPYAIILCKHCYKRLKIPTKIAFNETFIESMRTFIYYKLYNIYWFDLRKYKPIRKFVGELRNKIKR